MRLNTVLITVALLVCSLIIGFSVYAGLERQQIIRATQEKQEYIGRRKSECFSILQREKEREKDQHFTAASVEYFEPSSNPYEGKDFDDSCRVKYDYLIRNSDGTTRIESEYQSF